MRAPEFWAHDTLPGRLLRPLGEAYGLAGRLRRRLARPTRVAVPVVCIGNLVAGGAGKTPVAMAVAAELIARGQRPHLLCRGYRGRLPGPVRVDLARHDAAAVGDEALLLAAVAPTWCGCDRVAAARAAMAAGADLLIMDDGLQNPWLHQDLALLVVDGGFGFGNRRLLPGGPLREPLRAGFARASAIVQLGEDEVGLEALLPARLPRLRARLRPGPDAPDLRGRRVVAFAGIGRPEKFFRSLADAGALLLARHAFADHHRYRRREVQALLAEAAARDAVCVTTAKDRVRLPAELQGSITIMPVTVSWREPEALAQLLERLPNRSNAGGSADHKRDTSLCRTP
jgi:tetraacyldisaccharide 4'-kinase